jgi:hypothetical protein
MLFFIVTAGMPPNTDRIPITNMVRLRFDISKINYRCGRYDMEHHIEPHQFRFDLLRIKCEIIVNTGCLIFLT